MSKSAVALVCLNALVAMMAFAGIGVGETEPLVIAALLALVASALNTVALVRRRDAAPARRSHRDAEQEMSPHALLDLDGRLEALERAERRRTDDEADRLRRFDEREGLTPVPELDDDGLDGPYRGSAAARRTR